MGLDLTDIIVAVIAFCGTLAGSYFSQKRSTDLVVYRLEQLEKKVQTHNNVIERTYKLEQNFAVLDEKIDVANKRLLDLEKKVE